MNCYFFIVLYFFNVIDFIINSFYDFTFSNINVLIRILSFSNLKNLYWRYLLNNYVLYDFHMDTFIIKYYIFFNNFFIENNTII